MKNILEYLENTKQRVPNHIAVDDGQMQLTWEELIDLSRRIGSGLCEKTEPGKPVVILAEKSAITLAAMFGVVYAGCFYVMIDPGQPAARIQQIFRILEPQLVLLKEENEKLLSQTDYSKERCFLRELLGEPVYVEKLERIRQNSKETDLLYGIFTSGSTGIPKGVVVSHKAVLQFIAHFMEVAEITECDRIGNQAPFDFDVSVKDIYSSIATGASLVLIPKEFFSTPAILLDYLCEKEVTTLIWAVSALSLVSALKGLHYRVPEKVSKVFFSGETMPGKQLRAWQKALPDTKFVNLYGPTEITCNCTYYPIEKLAEPEEKIPIGRAIPGRRVFLLDENKKEIAGEGQTGEICVSGESLSEGYYNNPEETAKRFFFLDGERCYQTGDLGYYDADGLLYFVGRKDFQIKHMGHRIELEEISHAIEQVEGVERSCCLMNDRKKELVAFYFGKADKQSVREYLKAHVPGYMIPQKIIQTEEMPLNKNGKTDRDYLQKKMEVMKI